MPMPPDQKSSLTEMVDVAEGMVGSLDLIIQGLSASASVVAWHVGVASPGFLGLLWNAKEMSEHTHLGRHAFAALVIGAETSFLAGIIAAVVIYGRYNKFSDRMAQANIQIRAALQVVRIGLATGEFADDTASALADAKTEIRAVTKQLKAWERTAPKAFQAATWINNYAPVLAYSLIGILILAQWF